MNETELKLRGETEKWLKKIESIRIEPKNKKGEEFLKNIKAYVSDCKYFLEKNDFIKSFEAIIWAWALYESGKEFGLF